MEQYGYKIKTKKDTYERKENLDVELVIDTLKNIKNFDTCILMSGDSDFASLIDELKENKKWVIVLSAKGHISRELIERAKYINIGKLKSYLILEQ